MDEAERLCDRVAVIDSGRVVVTDTPAALAERSGAAQRIQFQPSEPFDHGLLASLPEVTSVIHRVIPGGGDAVEVTGTGDLLSPVMSVLARHQIVARQLRVEQANLEDAFLELIGRPGAAEGKE
jgi:ABC-2 type transport system ATP-binding protein